MMQCPQCGERTFYLTGTVPVDVSGTVECLDDGTVCIDPRYIGLVPDDLERYDEQVQCIHCQMTCTQMQAMEAFDLWDEASAQTADPNQLPLL